ncbi:hypothetical protein I302_109037 [Kwoniella bestiolae CBS 10118]|uniref:type I protein arginine methyltransferase n=1 Tax=Kwoniella bestiolae CBS 10118 TaxID=1296100 RepID=A0AAJ8MD27_9TREE
MSYQVNLPSSAASISSSSSISDEEDDRLSDWASSLGEARQTKSLFDETVLPSPEAALEHDANIWDFRLQETCQKLGLDMFGRIRLINLIRNAGLAKDQIEALSSSDPLFKDDNLLRPVIPDDPLLQYDPDDSWSDDEDLPQPPRSTAGPSQSQSSSTAENSRISQLEAELEQARRDLASMRSLISKTVGVEDDDQDQSSVESSTQVEGKGKGKAVERDDDTHYFHSYEENDIHEIMLKDTVRTVSYARFILSNPQVFKDAIVMDVGCGTGILSMLAAKAGAKHVYAIEASGLAVKARANIKKNGFENIITVIQGKVEDIQLPVKEVDVIVSEWMGYMLLYESMLDSVLVARDRFLSASGLMASAQSQVTERGRRGYPSGLRSMDSILVRCNYETFEGLDRWWWIQEIRSGIDMFRPPSTPRSTAGPSQSQSSSTAENSRISQLEAELEQARRDLASMRSLISKTVGVEDDDQDQSSVESSTQVEGKGKGKAVERDDDTHYFHSYEENDIHEIMLKDTVRTVSYARFILSNPQVFKDAIVMDVGCGTGILSMLAAKAGAKHVYAIEASGLAVKARANIKKNGFENIITVIQGKVEDIQLPVKEVDVIVSEWMGYMLLYESMLDSVLVARDRFLSASGLMAPSQTRLVISAITGDRTWKERISFWPSVYGFDLSEMQLPAFEEGLTEVVDRDEVVTSEAVVRDINSHNATIKSLDFHSSFTLSSTSSSEVQIKAFLTHFDTFFSPISGGAFHTSLDEDVEILPFRDDEYEHPVQSLSSKGKEGEGVKVSFTTGPRGKYTHWKQVVFLLRKHITLRSNEKIEGRFYCRKSENNSRELDVEIHYRVVGEKEKEGSYEVQCYKVR